jgi:hypothetical protein
MSIVDSGIDNRKDDAGIALRYLPRLRRMNFSSRSSSVLPGIVQIPLPGELRIVRESRILNRVDDIVRLA